MLSPLSCLGVDCELVMVDESLVRLIWVEDLRRGASSKPDVLTRAQASLRCVLKSEVVIFQPCSLRPEPGEFDTCHEAVSLATDSILKLAQQ